MIERKRIIFEKIIYFYFRISEERRKWNLFSLKKKKRRRIHLCRQKPKFNSHFEKRPPGGKQKLRAGQTKRLMWASESVREGSGHGEPLKLSPRAPRTNCGFFFNSYEQRKRWSFGSQIPRRYSQSPSRLCRPFPFRYLSFCFEVCEGKQFLHFNLYRTWYAKNFAAKEREVLAILKLLTQTAKIFPGVFYHGKATAVLPIMGRILPFFAEPAFRWGTGKCYVSFFPFNFFFNGVFV